MRAAGARAVMRLARHCLGPSRCDWGAAMEAEFDEAVRHGKPLAFATGCLFAAWREMGMREEGRGVLAHYAIAVGMLLPMAALQLGNAVGLAAPYDDRPAIAALADTFGGNPYLISVEANTASVVVLLWLVLAAAHVGLAWTLVGEDWSRIVKAGAVIGATTMTLAVFAGVTMLDMSALAPEVAGLMVECVAIGLVARRHARSGRILPDAIGA